jgi:hypothetical protein
MTTDPIPVPPFKEGFIPESCAGGGVHTVEGEQESTIIVESEQQATPVEE